MKNCRYLGELYQWSPAGDHPDVFRCLGYFGFCTLEPSGLATAAGPLHSCRDCKQRIEDEAADSLRAARGNCRHRGPVVRSDESNLCGTRGDQIEIYSCDVPEIGECSIGRYCQHQTVQTCILCDKFTPPEGAEND